jgi:hypothetical protein
MNSSWWENPTGWEIVWVKKWEFSKPGSGKVSKSGNNRQFFWLFFFPATHTSEFIETVFTNHFKCCQLSGYKWTAFSMWKTFFALWVVESGNFWKKVDTFGAIIELLIET